MIPHAEAARLYAAYLNAPRDAFSHDLEEREMFEQDTDRARAEMERAWLESTPILPSATGDEKS